MREGDPGHCDLRMMLIQPCLDRREGRIGILSHGEMIVKDHPFAEKPQDIRHRHRTPLLYFFPAEAVGKDIQNKLFSSGAVAKDDRRTDEKRLG